MTELPFGLHNAGPEMKKKNASFKKMKLLPAPNLSALVSNKTGRIWVSSQGWKPAVSSVYFGFCYYDKFQLRVETQPKIET